MFSSSQGTLSNAAGIVVGALGTLPAGGTGTITIVVRPRETGTLTNTANVTRNEPDAYTRNNSAIALTSVQVPAISVDDVSVEEGNSGATAANFTLHLSLPSPQPVSVDYSTIDGDALAGSDYIPTNGTVVFAVGQTTQTVTVLVIGDLINEADEQFFLELSNPTNATIAQGEAVGTILNDDPVPTVTIGDASVTEG
jgi:hypothetical protein